MSFRPEPQRDQLDSYIEWSLKQYASSTPSPRDGKRRLLNAAASSSSARANRIIDPFLVLRALGHVLVTLLIIAEKIVLYGPLPTEEELPLSSTRSGHVPFESKVVMHSVSHLYPTGVGYLSLIN